LLVTAAALSMSCSGDDGGSDTTGTSGTTSTAGTNSTAGNSSGGTNANAGTNSTSGSNNGGTNNGGTNNPPQGGEGQDPNQGGQGQDPFPQGGGGPGMVDECAGDVMDGAECNNGQDDPCTQAAGGVCFCGGNDEWNCVDFGGGGAGPGGNGADCGDAPMTDDNCDGFGQCDGAAGCFCFQGNVTCQ